MIAKTFIDVDEKNRFEIYELSGKVHFTHFYKMESGEWVIKGGLRLSPETAAGFGICLIEKAGKDKLMLKPKYQRKDN